MASQRTKWMKGGPSPNPRGRPKGSKNRRKRESLPALPVLAADPAGKASKSKTAEFIELAQSLAPEALQHVLAIMRADQGVAGLQAARLIIERAHGRPMDGVEVSRMAWPIQGENGPTTIEIVFVKALPRTIEGRVIDEALPDPSDPIH